MNLAKARFNMVEQQIRPWSVNDSKVLDLMATLPREQFVPEAYADLAFADFQIPLAHGEYMFCPKEEARALDALALNGTESVLEIGTGSGFLTSALAHLSAKVTTIDMHQDFIASADQRFSKLGITNVQSEIIEVSEQWHPSDRFDVIVVAASVHKAPKSLLKSLKPSGKLFCVLIDQVDYAYLLYNNGQSIEHKRLFEMTAKPLENFEKSKDFVF